MEQNKPRQLPLGTLLLLVFLPGIALLFTYIACMPLRDTIPPTLSFLVLILFVLAPIELFIIGRYSKKDTGRFGLASAWDGYQKLPWYKIALYALPAIIVGAPVFMLTNIAESALTGPLFQFVPGYFYLADFAQTFLNYPKSVIAITCIVFMVANGVVGPIVEELYFRGFLMSRISRFGKWAPLLINVLFSLYHLFSPWEIVTRILGCMWMHYAVWKHKNIYIGMVVHCFMNIGSGVLFIVPILLAL